MSQLTQTFGEDEVPVSCTIQCQHCDASITLSALSDQVALVWDSDWDK